jgi:hypothetical protein
MVVPLKELQNFLLFSNSFVEIEKYLYRCCSKTLFNFNAFSIPADVTFLAGKTDMNI